MEAIEAPLDKVNIPYVTAEIIVAVSGVIGNALVLYAFCANRSLRRQSRNYYIFSLALADLLVGLIGIPLAILTSVGLPKSLNWCLFSISTLVVLCTISIVCLVGVSVDRIWATTNPVSYHRRMNSTISISVIGVCWVVGALVGFMPLMGWYNAEGWHRIQRCEFRQVVSYSYLAFLYFATCLVPTLMLCGIYGYIYRNVIWRIRRNNAAKALTARSIERRSSDVAAEKMAQFNKLREARTAAKLGSIVLFFCLCWMPLYTINCIQCFVQVEIPPTLMYLVIILSHANSSLNPFMYAYYLRDFRASMKNAICNSFQCCFGWCKPKGYIVNSRGRVPWSSSGDAVEDTASGVLSNQGTSDRLPEHV